jgi:NADH dehydrogenase
VSTDVSGHGSGAEHAAEGRRVVVIGGGYAGVLAALRAARRLRRQECSLAAGAHGSAPGARTEAPAAGEPISRQRLRGAAEVVLLSDRDALIERIRLHESAASGRDPRRPLAALLRGSGVRLVHARADDVDVARRTVRAGALVLHWERLIVALGTRSVAPSVPGAAEHARVLDPERIATLATELRALAARRGRVVVVGGGLSGLEAATEIAEAHPALRVLLATAGEVGERLSPGARAHVRAVCARLGIELRENARATSVRADAVVIDGDEIASDLCLAAAGFEVPGELARWGFPVDARGRARTDEALRLEGAPHVYVAGDCAAPRGGALTMGCKSAMPMGAHAGDNAAASLLGARERPMAWVDLAWCTSLGRRDGVLQAMRPDGTPSRAFLSGWPAARMKEIICRYTVRSIELERDGLLAYRWPRGWLWALSGRALPRLPVAAASR